MTALKTVLLPVGGKEATGVICPGQPEPRRRVCGQTLTRAGRCPNCKRYLTESEYAAAKAAREAA